MLSRSGRTGGRYPGPLCHGCRAGGNLPGSKRGGRRLDLAVGITLGALIGVAVIVAFVFFGSEGTIDAPRISGVDTGKPAPAPKSKPASKPRNLPAIPVVRVISGAPHLLARPGCAFSAASASAFASTPMLRSGLKSPATGSRRRLNLARSSPSKPIAQASSRSSLPPLTSASPTFGSRPDLPLDQRISARRFSRAAETSSRTGPSASRSTSDSRNPSMISDFAAAGPSPREVR